MTSIRVELMLPVLLTAPVQAQILAGGDNQKVTLGGGIETVIARGIDQENSFYYLPKTIQVSRKAGVPEMSLMLFQDSKNKFTGGILHVLLTWGLSPAQQEELGRFLTTKIDSAASLNGAAEIELSPNEVSFTNDADLAPRFTSCSSSAIRLATTAQQKAAVSFKLTASIAEYLHNRISANGKSALTLEARYTYVVVEPGKNISIAERKSETMTTSLNEWIKELKKYKLIKIVKV